MKSVKCKVKSGFTLMELMIVMVIMGILILVGLTSFMSSSQKGRDNRRKSDLRQIATALEAYYSDKSQYPNDNGSGKMMGCGVGATALCNWGDIFSNTTNNTIYMIKLPADPSSTLQYYYVKRGNGYSLYAKLENAQDLLNLITPAVSTNCASSGTAVQCNWGISSSNVTP